MKLIPILFIFLFINISISQPAFPIAPKGLCYDGVQKLLQYYPDATIAYNSGPKQGHVWVIVDGQPIDSFYGNISGSYWENPEFRFANMNDLDLKISELTGIRF